MFAEEPKLVCQECGREYAYNYRRGHSKRQCNSCRSNRCGLRGRRARQEIKRRMVEYKGGRCERCGYDRCTAALSFHHTGEKRFNVAGSQHRSWPVLMAELNKCILLCMNCHAEEHDELTERQYVED